MLGLQEIGFGGMDMNDFHYQDEGIIREFQGLKFVELQEKCKNLGLRYDFFENGNGKEIFSFVAIAANNSISIFITNERNEYIPLRTTP